MKQMRINDENGEIWQKNFYLENCSTLGMWGYQKNRIELLSKEKHVLKLSDPTDAPKWQNRRNLAKMLFRKLFYTRHVEYQ